jgi:hypothetical protein
MTLDKIARGSQCLPLKMLRSPPYMKPRNRYSSAGPTTSRETAIRTQASVGVTSSTGLGLLSKSRALGLNCIIIVITITEKTNPSKVKAPKSPKPFFKANRLFLAALDRSVLPKIKLTTKRGMPYTTK